jgi:hypothetical protein
MNDFFDLVMHLVPEKAVRDAQTGEADQVLCVMSTMMTLGALLGIRIAEADQATASRIADAIVAASAGGQTEWVTESVAFALRTVAATEAAVGIMAH